MWSALQQTASSYCSQPPQAREVYHATEPRPSTGCLRSSISLLPRLDCSWVLALAGLAGNRQNYHRCRALQGTVSFPRDDACPLAPSRRAVFVTMCLFP
jgi:hypothetical protein